MVDWVRWLISYSYHQIQQAVTVFTEKTVCLFLPGYGHFAQFLGKFYPRDALYLNQFVDASHCRLVIACNKMRAYTKCVDFMALLLERNQDALVNLVAGHTQA